ncbi:hypothetical protein GUJ93_ZPchr0006g46412 [Zizania palustris]|uniref:Uncharacterized protein n=1 Tax=Zizania palustris TaxID=103762 RepID=A0A8J5W4L5_ZIZPA|nr:hypothetical protein GUJ93_ZPchr0006g46412 [Zizania palustris]
MASTSIFSHCLKLLELNASMILSLQHIHPHPPCEIINNQHKVIVTSCCRGGDRTIEINVHQLEWFLCSVLCHCWEWIVCLLRCQAHMTQLVWV